MVLYTGSHSTEPQMMSSSALDSWICWTLWKLGMGRESGRESNLSGWLVPCLCQAYTGWYSHTSACTEASAEVGEGHMDGLVLDHFQQLMVILYSDMPAIWM